MDTDISKDLLEKIFEATGCSYMSDLHCSSLLIRITIIEKIHQLNADDYSLAEWTKAVNYITNSKHEYKSVKEATDYLVSCELK